MNRSLCALVALGLIAAGAHAQPAAPLQPGDRVLVANPSAGAPHTLLSATPDSLSLRGPKGDTVQVGLNDVRSIWKSAGRRSVGRGALRGAAIGFVIGGAIGLIDPINSSVYLYDDGFGGTGDRLAYAAFVGVAGAGIGAITGALIRGERWERIPLEALRLSVTPAGRPGLALSLRF